MNQEDLPETWESWVSQNSKHTLFSAWGLIGGAVSNEGIQWERKKCALLKRPPGKIIDLLEASDLISNEIEGIKKKKCRLTFIILNRLPQFLSIRLKGFRNSHKTSLSIGFNELQTQKAGGNI